MRPGNKGHYKGQFTNAGWNARRANHGLPVPSSGGFDMSMLDPNAAAAEWATRLSQSGAKITAGVNAVTVAPGQKAAAQKGLYVQRVQERADYWAARTASVSLGDWQASMTGKGVQRIAGGAQAAQGKMADFLAQLYPHIQQGLQKLPPRADLETNIGRSAAMARHMAGFRRR